MAKSVMAETETAEFSLQHIEVQRLIAKPFNKIPGNLPGSALHHCPLPCEGRLPEVSRWKDTAGPERVSAFDAASFPLCAPSVVQVSQRELPFSMGGLG